MKHPASLASRLGVSLSVLILLLAISRAYVSTQTPAAKPPAFDREYILEATMIGYRGVGGEIDGVRNPTLWARTGESVRITIVNGELMVHDIALEGMNIKSPQILDKGARPTSRSRRPRATSTTVRSPAIGWRAWRAASTSPTSRG